MTLGVQTASRFTSLCIPCLATATHFPQQEKHAAFIEICAEVKLI